jgi:terminase small subunit-like protein
MLMSLTPKQRQFVDSYLRHGNASVAAVEAGYSRERARQAAHEILKNEKVAAEIEKRQTKASLTEITKSSKDINDEYVLGLIVKQISAIEEHGLGGWQVQGLAKFIEMLARYRGMFTEKIEVDLGGNIMQKLLEGR